MFEEVPRARRGLAGLTTRRVVLGPFVIGGGVLLAAVGGSVAVAATVITASSIHASDVPPRPAPHPVIAASPASHRPAHHQPAASSSASSSASQPASQPTSPSRVAVTGPPVTSSPSQPVALPAPPSSTASTAHSSRPAASPSQTSSGPAGNAVIFVSGYDQASQRLVFEFAVVSHGTGPNGSDVYRVESARQFSAGLASDLTVTSDGQLCPPAGSRCTTEQLIAGAGTGFFAIAAIDPADQLHSIIEVDNVGSSFAPGPSPSPTPTASPTGS